MRNLPVSDVMTRNPVSALPDTNLLECARKMVSKRVGSLLLVKGGKFYGIITNRDILWALVRKSEENLSKIKAVNIAPKKFLTIKPDAKIDEALSKMKSRGFERLPVVLNGEIVGLITVKDILNFHPEFYPELEEFAQIKEEKEKLRRIRERDGEKTDEEGVCEECGKQNILQRFNGMLVCESCLSSL
jgi:CBS domain-containing protein